MEQSEHQLRLLRSRRWHGLRNMVLTTIGVLAVMSASYWLGARRTEPSTVPLDSGAIQAPSCDRECPQELEECRQQAVNLGKGAEIDAGVLAQARSEAAQARSRIERLEQEMTLYRSLVDDSVRTAGVSAHSLEIVRVPPVVEQRYRYRLTFIQRASRYVELQGFATVTVQGTEGGKPRSVGLSELAGTRSDGRLPLRFVYFQTLEGEYSLPLGFQPLRVRVQADIRTGRPQKVERTFDWALLED
jgi:hypothetical protein